MNKQTDMTVKYSPIFSIFLSSPIRIRKELTIPFINEKMPPIKAKGNISMAIKSSKDIFFLLFAGSKEESQYGILVIRIAAIMSTILKLEN